MRQSGLSLIELLVSMVIAMIIFGGVIGVVQTSRATFNSEQESGFIQENARYAVEVLSRDIRHAGYLGCIDRRVGGLAYTIDGNNFDGLYDSTAISGYAAGAGAWPDVLTDAIPSDESDALILRYADAERAVYVSAHSDAEIALSSTHDIEAGEPAIIVNANCRNAAVFSNSAVTAARMTPTCSELYTDIEADRFSDDAATCADLESSPASEVFGASSTVMPYVAYAYFIGDSEVVPGMPALKRRAVAGGAVRTEELAQGIERMSFEYGLDTGASPDGVVDRFVAALDMTAADWDMVIAVRFELLFRSQSEIFSTPQTYRFAGEDVTPDDRFLRQLASSTIQMRNR